MKSPKPKPPNNSEFSEANLPTLMEIMLGIREELKRIEAKTIPLNKYLTSKEVMLLIQVSENTLQKMREQGRIEFYQIGDFSFRYPSSQFIQTKRAA